MVRGVGQHHGDLRRALVDAALAIVAEEDVEGLSLRAVARRAGVSPAAPYHHFPDKGALLAEVAREGFAALAAEQAAALGGRGANDASGDTGARLEAMAEAYVRFALAHRAHYRTMFDASPSAVGGPGAASLQETARATFQTLVDAIRAVNPRLDAAEARGRALLAWAQAHGAVAIAGWAEGLDPAARADAIAAGVGRAVRMLAEAPGRAP